MKTKIENNVCGRKLAKGIMSALLLLIITTFGMSNVANANDNSALDTVAILQKIESQLGKPIHSWKIAESDTILLGVNADSVLNEMKIRIQNEIISKGGTLAPKSSAASITGSTPQVKIFPNPTSNYLDVGLNDVCEKIAVEVLDITGKSLFKMSFEGKKDFRINFPFALLNGSYRLRITADGQQSTTSFMIVAD
jgi:hypothetical protein